ncbi:hypothetical protein BBB39_11260 [Bordetella trematum]|uniref:ABC transporter substrate binding protein n=2 Tax=Bordetella trematum TaxID=123899 RepID=A0A157SRP8_9BORD|nr:transporter substrate-binding domain-containing protein [Bordetella trematum]AZR94300.1 hypothetical protein BBB39_11260 [Bordetella trematum]SAI53209.1 ABC transporter substrate binding protein [Bordetella trematum]SAI73089.1 ABC transporter substrate binding protein [Bordetella trematum]SUV97510.1 ABC transporter substrate binding protein [Bordetella trematum]
MSESRCRAGWGTWLAALALMLSAGVSAAAGPFAQAQARGELRVGVPALADAQRVRTPHGLGPLAAERLAQALGLPLALQALAADQAADALAAGQVDVVLMAAGEPPGVAPRQAWVAARYQPQPRAVIRSDTPMRRWEEARGRSVCMARANQPARALAHSHGAVLQEYDLPSEALVAVREGRCDIGLIDDAAWQSLMQLPEWRKFSASLPPEGPHAESGWLVPAAEQAWLAREMRLWQGRGVWRELAGRWAREVAFDVYLDQDGIDCHG